MSLKLIAAQAGVSQTTVSLVLNGKPIRISEEKRRLILEAAQEIGYTTDRRLSTQIPNVAILSIGSQINPVSYPVNSSSYNTRYLAFVENFMSSLLNKVNVLIRSTGSSESPLSFLQSLIGASLYGCVAFMGHQQFSEQDQVITHPVFELLRDNNIPIVFCSNSVQKQPIQTAYTLQMDTYKGGYIATEHLLRLGHRRIGIVYNMKILPKHSARFHGYRQAMADYGLDVPKEWMIYSGSNAPLRYNVASTLRKHRLSAVFAHNDDVALGLYAQLAKEGMRVPEDISIVGNDDINYAQMFTPPLTTVDYNLQSFGKYCMDMFDAFHGSVSKVEYTTLTIDPTLIKRQSTAEYHGD